ncbi:aspartyl-phosphate phosphatase Spo0E family protein [Geosporobacter ferrireducens]|nr:aspartyl-phosphate phosphatase Spo0E family protein [Geosporobacter ferrireducens]MTI53930.1 aspartyl-phosphate phosphatase Spo0E family protein [Geosporobacter ferrireducens]
MLKYDIEQMREVLNELMAKGGNYEEIYKVSIALDQLIADYYKEMSAI